MARIACAAALLLLVLTAPAGAFQTCTYNAGTQTATATFGNEDTGTLSISGTQVRADGAQCGTATTSNTDTIEVVGDDTTDEQLTIDLAGGPFLGGVDDETGTSDEIEIEVDLKVQPGVIPLAYDTLVQGSAGADHVSVGLIGPFLDEDTAINLNANEAATVDADVTFTGSRSIRVEGLAGNDVLDAGGGPEFDLGSDLTDLRGGADNDDITAGFVTPGPGNDTIRCPGVGGCFQISYFDAPAGVTVATGDGSGGNWGGATDDGQGGVDTYVGDPFLIQGSNVGGDTFNGGGLNDTVYGNGGADVFNGGGLNDTFRGGSGNDTGHGGPGIDTLWGDTGEDDLFGNAGNDSIAGGLGQDDVDGGADDDELREAATGDFTNPTPAAPSGPDNLAGGTGTDTVQYANPLSASSGRTADITVDLDDQPDDGAAGENDNVKPDVENVLAGRGNDTLFGDGEPNSFDGWVGNDHFEVRDGGADTVTCGAGNDTGNADRSDTIGSDCESIALPVEMPADPPVTTPPSDPPPVTTPPPATTPPVTPPATPPVAAPPTISQLLALPSRRRCVSRRRFTVRVRRQIRGQVRRVTIFVNGRRVRTVTGRRIGLPIDLRGLPKGRIRVRLRVELADGRIATDTRTYRTCATKRRRGRFGRRRG